MKADPGNYHEVERQMKRKIVVDTMFVLRASLSHLCPKAQQKKLEELLTKMEFLNDIGRKEDEETLYESAKTIIKKLRACRN